MTINYNPRCVQDGLVLCLDPANFRSYPGSGTVCYDLSEQGNNATLTDGVSYNYAGEQRNLFTYTEQFDNGIFYKNQVTAVANSGTAPDSTLSADFLAATATTGYHTVVQGFNFVANQTYTWSIHLKSNQYTKAHIAEGYNGTFNCTIDLASGIIISSGGYISSTFLNLDNGWKRVGITFKPTTSFGSSIGVIGYPDSGATLNVYGAQYTGSPNSGIFAWGIQFEKGSVMTEYQRIVERDVKPSFLFDGINDMIRVPSPSNKFAWTPSGVGLNNITIDMWIKSSDSDGYYLSKPWSGGGEYNYTITPTQFTTSTNNITHVSSFSSLSTGRWEHICTIVNPTQKAVYRNGKLASSFTNHNHVINGPFGANTNESMCIMSLYPYSVPWTGATGFSINGNVGFIKIYNRVLSAAEILQNYNTVRGRFGL